MFTLIEVLRLMRQREWLSPELLSRCRPLRQLAAARTSAAWLPGCGPIATIAPGIDAFQGHQSLPIGSRQFL